MLMWYKPHAGPSARDYIDMVLVSKRLFILGRPLSKTMTNGILNHKTTTAAVDVLSFSGALQG